MKVVIAGAGSVGRFMARQLTKSGHDVTIIEVTPAVVARYRESVSELAKKGEYDEARSTADRQRQTSTTLRWQAGDACEVDTLAAAGCAEADVLAAATGDDEDNLVISLLAKQEFGVPRVLARVNNPDNEWMFNDMWGVDLSVSTPHLLTAMVEEAVSVGSLVRLLSFEGGKVRLSEVTLSDDSPAVGQEIVAVGLPRESTIVAVIRDHHVIVPRGDTVLRAHDEVLVLVTDESEADVRSRLVR